jgi:hypothetical protein
VSESRLGPLVVRWLGIDGDGLTGADVMTYESWQKRIGIWDCDTPGYAQSLCSKGLSLAKRNYSRLRRDRRQEAVAIDFSLSRPVFARIQISDSNGGPDDGEVCKIAPCRKRHRDSQESDSGQVDIWSLQGAKKLGSRGVLVRCWRFQDGDESDDD